MRNPPNNANTKTKHQKHIPVWLLIFFLIFFWPVGLVLLIVQIRKHKEQRISSAVITLSIGALLFLVSGNELLEAFGMPWNSQAEFLSASTPETWLLVFSFVFIIPGIFILARGLSDRKLLRFAGDGLSDPEDLELLLHKPARKVQKQINRLEKEGRWGVRRKKCLMN